MQIKKIILIIVIFLIIEDFGIAQEKEIPKEFCVSASSFELFNLINNLRIEKGLAPISLSASLSYIADLHLNDLIMNHPDTGLCNLHSWSGKGQWTAGCYQSYIPIQDCMWNKPKELTPYKYRGYELAFWQAESISIEEILAGWMDIPQAANMILNKGNWNNDWRAMGVGLKNGYALIWFGRAADTEPKPNICGKSETTSKEDKPVIKEKTNQYYLIFGSYNRLKDAEKRLARLQKDGFKETVILMTENKYRIALSSYRDLVSAKTAKSNLDKKYKEAWILKF